MVIELQTLASSVRTGRRGSSPRAFVFEKRCRNRGGHEIYRCLVMSCPWGKTTSLRVRDCEAIQKRDASQLSYESFDPSYHRVSHDYCEERRGCCSRKDKNVNTPEVWCLFPLSAADDVVSASSCSTRHLRVLLSHFASVPFVRE
jgi:hypothetical protein